MSRWSGRRARFRKILEGDACVYPASVFDPVSARKSLSAETTLDRDLSAARDLSPILWRLSEKVARGLKSESLAGRTVTLKLKTGRFRLLTRSRTLPDPTRSAEAIYRAAQPLLLREAKGTAYRLIGVGVSGFAPPAEVGLFDLADPDAPRRAKLEDAVETLRDRFGPKVIGKGRGLIS